MHPLTDKASNRVFKKGDVVHKVFDTFTEPYLHPNVDFMTKYGQIEAEVYSLTPDNQVVVLKYKFIDGNHEPNNIENFIPICKILDKMHADTVVATW